MVVSTWLRTLLSRKDRSSRRDRRSKKAPPLRRWVPAFEKLEERWVLSPTTTLLIDNTAGSSTYGSDVPFLALVSDNSAGRVGEGTVQFNVDGTNVGTPVTVDALGQATF